MTTVLIVIHLMVVVAMIGLVLLQRSEGGALGIGGSGAFMTGRGAANMLTRSTGILAAAFFVTSIGLALLGRLESGPTDIFRNLPGQTAPVTSETPTPAPPVSGGGGGSAEEMLRQLQGEAGPQTPPAEGAGAPAETPPTGSEAGTPAETPPAEGGGQQQ